MRTQQLACLDSMISLLCGDSLVNTFQNAFNKVTYDTSVFRFLKKFESTKSVIFVFIVKV